MLRSDEEKDFRLQKVREENIKLKELQMNLYDTLSSSAGKKEQNALLTQEGGIEEDELEEEYKALPHEIEEKDSISEEELLLEKELTAANEYNKKLRGAIKAHYQRIDQLIADRSKIRNTILNFFDAMRKFIIEKKTHAPKSTLQEFEEKAGDLRTRKSGKYAPTNELDQCSIEELKNNVTLLIERLNQDKTIEEKAGKLLQWVAKNCKAAYNYTFSQSTSAVQSLIRTIRSSRSSSVAEQGVFSFKNHGDDDYDDAFDQIRPTSRGPLPHGDL
jgi:hypothetical protein